MYPTLRFLAGAGAQRLVPFSKTGITGIFTHPNPRPALIAVYNHTLTLLSRLPSHSVYRQSIENLTRYRLAIVESVKPEGWEEFQARLKVERERLGLQSKDTAFELKVVGRQFLEVAGTVVTQNPVMKEFLQKELNRWEVDPAPEDAPQTVGAALPAPEVYVEDPAGGGEAPDMARSAALEEVPLLLEEPPLYEEQVLELEEKLRAGLIEEVIDQGWMELTLVKEMEETEIWEPLETAEAERRKLLVEAVEKAQAAGFPTDEEDIDAYYMSEVARGEKLCQGGDDRALEAALCFYKALKTYPKPKSLISIYDKTLSKSVLDILAEMIATDGSLLSAGCLPTGSTPAKIKLSLDRNDHKLPNNR